MKITDYCNYKAFRLLLLPVLVLALVSGAQAAEKKDKNARRMQQIMQKAEQEKAELQTQIDAEKKAKAALESQVKESGEETVRLKGSMQAASRKAANLATEVTKLEKDKTALEAKLKEAEAQLAKVEKNLAETNQKLQLTQTELQSKESELRTRTRELESSTAASNQKQKVLEVCQTKNSKLYQFGTDLVKFYDRPSNYEIALRTEPFTQLKRVELENILQDYQDKLDEQKTMHVPK